LYCLGSAGECIAPALRFLAIEAIDILIVPLEALTSEPQSSDGFESFGWLVSLWFSALLAFRIQHASTVQLGATYIFVFVALRPQIFSY